MTVDFHIQWWSMRLHTSNRHFDAVSRHRAGTSGRGSPLSIVGRRTQELLPPVHIIIPMSPRLLFVCCLLACLWAQPSRAAEKPVSYLCVGEKRVGFVYDGRDWVSSKLDPSGKFVLARSRKPGATWDITYWGMKFPLVHCERDIDTKGLLFCDMNGDYRFNMTTLRYVEANFQGYLIADSPELSPPASARLTSTSIELGSCTPL